MQRVWASKNNTVLLLGAFIGGTMGALMCFGATVLGLISNWAGLQMLDSQGNLALLTVFEPHLSSWGLIITVILLVTLSESYIDSLQNGMVSSTATVYMAIKEEINYH